MRPFHLGGGLALTALAAVLPAQPATLPHAVQAYHLDSGYLSNPSTAELVVFQGTVTVPEEDWLQVRFKDTNLPPGTRLRLTSLADGAVQWFDGGSLRDYANASAFFNGNSVLVELIAGPGTRGNRVNVVEVMAGDAHPIGQKTICGTTDDRTLSSDPRQGRQHPTGCTSWLINATTIITAGHCVGGQQQIHFQVPLSTSSGGIVLPPPQHQYPYDTSTLQSLNGGIGNDWAVCATVRNSNTGLYAGQAQRSWYDLGTVPTSTAGQQIRITGYGTTAGGVPRQWNQVQKTHVGDLVGVPGTTLQYTADTTGGNSGSPVVHENTGDAIGIHTHGGCTSTGGSNSGTQIDRPDLQAAIAAIRNIKAAGLITARGNGCAGSSGTPSLGSEGFPDIGKTVALNATSLPANQPGALFLGGSGEIWNGNLLPFDMTGWGMAGCTLYTSLDLAIPLPASSTGTAAFLMAIPNSPALIRRGFFAQYAVVDPGVNVLGIVWTNGVAAVIGD